MSDKNKRGIGKNKQFLLNRLQDMYGADFHPIMQMADNAYTLQQVAVQEIELARLKNGGFDPDKVNAVKSAVTLANSAWSSVAEYTEPKLRATEVTGSVEHNHKHSTGELSEVADFLTEFTGAETAQHSKASIPH